jgi:hypothetical protein
MDGFVSRENIKRYRRFASESTDPAEQSRIIKVLAGESASSLWMRPGDAPEGRLPVDAVTENPVEHDGERQRSGS